MTERTFLQDYCPDERTWDKTRKPFNYLIVGSFGISSISSVKLLFY